MSSDMKRFILDEMETYIVSPVKHKAMADDFTPTARIARLFRSLVGTVVGLWMAHVGGAVPRAIGNDRL
jgi:hypothetical protein